MFYQTDELLTATRKRVTQASYHLLYYLDPIQRFDNFVGYPVLNDLQYLKLNLWIQKFL